MNHEALIHDALQYGELEDVRRLAEIVGHDQFGEALRTCPDDTVMLRMWAGLLHIPLEEVKGIREGRWWEHTRQRLEGERRIREQVGQLARQQAGGAVGRPRISVLLEPTDDGWVARSGELTAAGQTPEEALARFWQVVDRSADAKELARVWRTCLDRLERQLPKSSLKEMLGRS